MIRFTPGPSVGNPEWLPPFFTGVGILGSLRERGGILTRLFHIEPPIGPILRFWKWNPNHTLPQEISMISLVNPSPSWGFCRVWVAPKLGASVSFSSCTSAAKIFPALLMTVPWMAAWPSPPHPTMVTVSSQFLNPWNPANEEGNYPKRERLNSATYPDDSQLCYPKDTNGCTPVWGPSRKSHDHAFLAVRTGCRFRPPDNGFKSKNPRGNSTEPLIAWFHSHKIACSHSKIKASFISLWMETRIGPQPILGKIEDRCGRCLCGRLSVTLPWCN